MGSLAIVHSRANNGLLAPPVTVEVHISNGLPSLAIVGLPETAVKESKERVRSALINAQFEFPTRRVTINLAPADLPKEGGRFDLPIALGILAASQQIPLEALEQFEFAGELALSGELRPIEAVLPLALATREVGRKLVVPLENAEEALLPGGIDVFPASHLLEVCAHLTGNNLISAASSQRDKQPALFHYPDLADVNGQPIARRALEIAAAGGHSVLLVGPPGTGKTMLASRLPSILPPLMHQEALEVIAVHSIAKRELALSQWQQRPFRAPHHTASAVALVGGGNPPMPGEVSLAHHGVLFLDELPEFSRYVLETLREPLEAGVIRISRANHQAEFPARFQLIAAMNPCPCGQLGNPVAECRCTSEQIQRYSAKISGPLLDRIDLQIEVMPMIPNLLYQVEKKNETSQQVAARVLTARGIQWQRQSKLNHMLATQELQSFCDLTEDGKQLLQQALQKFYISTRSYHRILRVARTIADLADMAVIQSDHIAEALNYRTVLNK